MNDTLKKIINKHNFRIKKYAFLGNTKVLDTDQGCFTCKKTKNNYDTYRYLHSNQFNNFIDIYDVVDDYEIREYVESTNISNAEKALKIIYLISLLHNKTTYFKSINLDDLKKEYEEKIKELNDLYSYYENIRTHYEEEEYLSPSKYLLLRNISSIYIALDNSKYFLDSWFNLLKDKKNRRVAFVHNNLDLNHLINNDNLYLINWEYATNENPTYDLNSLYRHSYKDVDFRELLEIYNSKYQLYKEELYFFFYLISKPDLLKKTFREIDKVISNYQLTNYLIKTNDFVSETYSKEHDTNKD